MAGELSSYFIADHRRLETLLNNSLLETGEIDETVYADFRSGLLKHIGMEEKILMPAIKQRQNGSPYQYADTLRLEHGAFAALLVPPATPKIITVIQTIMIHHNEIEESKNGLYEICENLVGGSLKEFMVQVYHFPNVPVMPHVQNPNVLESTRRAVARAGYDFDKIAR